MTATCDDVIAAIKTVFPDRDVTEILAVVDVYGTARSRTRPTGDRGTEQRRREKTEVSGAVAKVDYRDVLAWKQLGPLSPAQGEKLQIEVCGLLEQWREK